MRYIHVGAREDFPADGFEVAIDVDGHRLEIGVDSIQGADRPALFYGKEGKQFLQEALETAWRLGLRPRGFEDHTGELKAVGRHLEDMRKITFNKLGVADF